MGRVATSSVRVEPPSTTVEVVYPRSFCAWWTTMADRSYDSDGNAKLRPRWRSKSVDRVMEERTALLQVRKTGLCLGG